LNVVDSSGKVFKVTPIKKLRVMYFFSETNKFDKFLKDTQVEIRFTDGPDWGKELAKGIIKPFGDFAKINDL
jgi:hypothetical protein